MFKLFTDSLVHYIWIPEVMDKKPDKSPSFYSALENTTFLVDHNCY